MEAEEDQEQNDEIAPEPRSKRNKVTPNSSAKSVSPDLPHPPSKWADKG